MTSHDSHRHPTPTAAAPTARPTFLVLFFCFLFTHWYHAPYSAVHFSHTRHDPTRRARTDVTLYTHALHARLRSISTRTRTSRPNFTKNKKTKHTRPVVARSTSSRQTRARASRRVEHAREVGRLGRLDGVDRTETRPRTTFGTSATVDEDDEGRRRRGGGAREAEADARAGNEAARGERGEATTEDGGGGGASTSTSVMSMSTSTSSVGGGRAEEDGGGGGTAGTRERAKTATAAATTKGRRGAER